MRTNPETGNNSSVPGTYSSHAILADRQSANCAILTPVAFCDPGFPESACSRFLRKLALRAIAGLCLAAAASTPTLAQQIPMIPYFNTGIDGASANRPASSTNDNRHWQYASNDVIEGKLVINPDSSSRLTPGETASIDIYQEKLDKIMIEYEFEDSDFMLMDTKVDGLAFKNTFFFDVPKEARGKIAITAYGFRKGKLEVMHSVELEIQ
ncbi:MAG: hypothetical protein LBO79_05305 [Zoogloeaceae bacterium]|jgi:hypothetical protein|nr:hypothetical protein [Zoogloeaceae bacterium]